MINNKICSSANKLIFACSAAADVGTLSDRVARELTLEGVGKMYCTAELGSKIDSILKSTREADII